METRQNHSHTQTQQRPMHWNLLPTNFPTVSNSQNFGESTPTAHHTQHTPNHTPTQFQDPSLHIHSPPSTRKSNSPRLQQINSPQRTIVVSLDLSKAFDTVNIHTFINKLHQTNVPNTA